MTDTIKPDISLILIPGSVRPATSRYRRLCSCSREIRPGDRMYYDCRFNKLRCTACCHLARGDGERAVCEPGSDVRPPATGLKSLRKE